MPSHKKSKLQKELSKARTSTSGKKADITRKTGVSKPSKPKTQKMKDPLSVPGKRGR